VDAQDARDLLATAVEPASGIWVDLGAGTGTFTHALASILSPPSRIYAVDSDRRALDGIRQGSAIPGVQVSSIVGDITDPATLAGIGEQKLNGILAANALHFVRDVEDVLARWITRLDGGRIVVIEYDRRDASRRVPYPLPPKRLEAIAATLGLPKPHVTATRPSEYSGLLYVATAENAARYRRRPRRRA